MFVVHQDSHHLSRSIGSQDDGRNISNPEVLVHKPSSKDILKPSSLFLQVQECSRKLSPLKLLKALFVHLIVRGPVEYILDPNFQTFGAVDLTSLATLSIRVASSSTAPLAPAAAHTSDNDDDDGN
ncbi:hypothetical protein B0H14DRAFT_2588250 [Mycena olivaceomarginata]|nr:hypothetical protein B0H14DRAFT_2588250 [Mycena olivaceomarginata]